MPKQLEQFKQNAFSRIRGFQIQGS